MSELSQCLDVEETIEHDGVTYRVGGITSEVMAAFEDWLERDTIEELNKLFPNSYSEVVKSMTSAIASGVFEFTGPEAQSRIGNLSGRKKLMFLRIRQNHMDVDEKAIADAVEDQWVAIIRIRQKEEAAMAALDPNADAPAPHEGAGDNQATMAESAGGPS